MSETGYGSPSGFTADADDGDVYDAGYGSPTSLFGDADDADLFDAGYGSPGGTAPGVYPTQRVFPDEGGWRCVLRGVWPTVGPYRVRLFDADGNGYPLVGCYGGKPWRGKPYQAAWTNAALDELEFALPPLAAGVYDIDVRWGDSFAEAALLEAAIRIVPANVSEEVHRLRRGFPDDYPAGDRFPR